MSTGGQDACESIGVLPTIRVYIEELNRDEFNAIRGISVATKDAELFETRGKGLSASASKSKNPSSGKGTCAPASATKGRKKASQEGYFRLKVRDNGCGMSHDKIPDLLGRVLSGSKYGVRQTRGKFGLGEFVPCVRVFVFFVFGLRHSKRKCREPTMGNTRHCLRAAPTYHLFLTPLALLSGAKMALIWSKKSTGVPIKVTTAHLLLPKSAAKKIKNHQGGFPDLEPPKKVSFCNLDIDITKNCPNIIEHTQRKNEEGWVGTELELLIAGNWTTYKSRIVTYLQQLAIITPYAQLELIYENRSEPHRNVTLRHDRRSEQMPPLPKEIKHHPSSVNNIIVSQLIERSNHDSLIDFLTKELSCVTRPLAVRIVKECGWKADDTDVEPSDLKSRELTKLVQVLRTVKMFRAPDGSCLSPLGEYNLNLGIRKVLEPEFVATARDKPSAYEGHPFLVEAAVSLGGNKEAKEGINVVRFANRIPLLFEAGADVCTRVATHKINWTSYKIDQKRDKIGVFVSIVSTKIPYKGTGKEYIGDDITAISVSVKRALQQCCQQLRVHLLKRNALRDQRDRKSKLVKYIPDVSRSLFELLEGMRKRRGDLASGIADPGVISSPRKRPKTEHVWEDKDAERVIGQLESGRITTAVLKKSLEEAVNVHNLNEEEEADKISKTKERIPLFLKPMFGLDDPGHDIVHPLFTFRPMVCPK